MRTFRILRTSQTTEETSCSENDSVSISRSELEALRARAEFATGQEAATEAREAEYARELAARDQKAENRERSLKEAIRDRELATALGGRSLVSGAFSQLVRLWRDDFEVYEEGGEHKVVARDGQPVAQAVAERLDLPEYAHFCLPTSRGGAAPKGVPRPGVAGLTAPTPSNLGEAVVQRWRESGAARAGGGLAPIGLNRRR